MNIQEIPHYFDDIPKITSILCITEDLPNEPSELDREYKNQEPSNPTQSLGPHGILSSHRGNVRWDF
jgi:hypothetical protein